MWYFLLVCIILGIVWEIYSILTGKPTRKVALKRCVNMWVYLLFGFGMPFSIIIILLLAIVGNQELAQSTYNVNVIVISDGLSWMFNIGMCSFLFVVALDALNVVVRKKNSQIISIYYNWIEKLDKEGFLKYTDDEKEYNKEQDIKSKAQIRRWFPFIKKFDKKKVV